LGVSGSGDTLAGIIVGLSARGATLAQAAAWGVVLHARAGIRLEAQFGRLGYLAREIAGQIPRLMQEFTSP
jgi:ADP-dependent NAD(P)H-hydrate dehydratase